MKAKISALMDGELERHEAGAALEALGNEGDARATWRAYHLIGDSMRDARLLSAGFAARVAEKISQEPTVLAPGRLQRAAANGPLWALAAAASLAVVFVGASTFLMMQQDRETPAQTVQAAPAKETAKELAQVAPPDAADDYLLAHQGYSPRNSLQGVAPYVRTVSSETRGARR